MRNKIIKEAINLCMQIGFGLTVGMFFAIWIIK